MNLVILRHNMVAIGFQSLKLLMALVWKVLGQNTFFFQAIHLSTTNLSVQLHGFFVTFFSLKCRVYADHLVPQVPLSGFVTLIQTLESDFAVST